MALVKLTTSLSSPTESIRSWTADLCFSRDSSRTFLTSCCEGSRESERGEGVSQKALFGPPSASSLATPLPFARPQSILPSTAFPRGLKEE